MKKILLLLAFPALAFSQRLVTANGVNAQTGTTYTYLTGDFGKLVTHSNASSIAATLPQANSTTFRSGWMFDVQNIGAGTLTITPTVSTINGAATLVLTAGQGAHVVSNGTNYSAQLGKGSSGSGGATSFVTTTHSATPTYTVPAGTNALTTFTHVLTGNVTSSTITGGLTTGQEVCFRIAQDGTGGRTYVRPTNVLNFATPMKIASAVTSQCGIYDGANVQALGPAIITGLGGLGQGFLITMGTAWPTPDTGQAAVYGLASDKKVHVKDDAGVDVALGAGGGGGGDASTNTATSVDGEAVLFSGAAGKTLKRSTLTGVVKSVSGVPSAVTGTATDCVLVDGTSGACGSGSTPTYTLCASGCSTTIPASGSTILASVHGQGANALGFYFDSSNVRALVSETRNSSGDLTIVYTGTLGRVIISGLAGGGGSSAASSLARAAVVDSASIQYREEFWASAWSAQLTPNYPPYPLTLLAPVAGTPTYLDKPAEANHMGIVTFATSGTSSDDAYLLFRSRTNFNDSMPRLDNITGWWFRRIFRPIAIANVRTRWGPTDQAAFSGTVNNGVGILLDTAVNGNYQFETRIAGTQSLTDSGVAANTANWIVFDCYSDVAGTVKYQINGGSVTSKAYTGSTALSLGLYIRTLTGSAASSDEDLWAFYIPVTR